MDNFVYVQHPYEDHPRVQLSFEGQVSLTKQASKDETDINWIMARFEKTGLLDHLNTHQGEYGDFIGFEDYHTSMNRIRDAEVAFATIPAKVRAHFNNDAAEFLRIAQDPDQHDLMVELGLARAAPGDGHEPVALPTEGEGPLPLEEAAGDASGAGG